MKIDKYEPRKHKKRIVILNALSLLFIIFFAINSGGGMENIGLAAFAPPAWIVWVWTFCEDIVFIGSILDHAIRK